MATQTLTTTPVLRLRATAPSPQQTRRPRIQWADTVVDNEALGRKSSKGMTTDTSRRNRFHLTLLCSLLHLSRPSSSRGVLLRRISFVFRERVV